MKAKKRFEETKIKMVMKLRGLTREAAIKALHLDNSPEGSDTAVTKHTTAREEPLISAKEFFGDLEGDGEFMTAEEFFKS